MKEEEGATAGGMGVIGGIGRGVGEEGGSAVTRIERSGVGVIEDGASRVERSLAEGFWNFPLEPTSQEICAALLARHNHHYEDGYPDNLVCLNRFFVMHKVGYRNGKGVKLEGWKTYDDHLMTKTSSGPLNGNENLVLRIFALRPVTKGVEPIKLCWVKELSKGHQSGRRKKYQPDDESHPNKKSRPNAITYKNSPLTPPATATSEMLNSLVVLSPASSSLPSPYRPDNMQHPKQEPLSPHSMHPKYRDMPPLPGLHETLAGISGTLPPFQLPISSELLNPAIHLKSESTSDQPYASSSLSSSSSRFRPWDASPGPTPSTANTSYISTPYSYQSPHLSSSSHPSSSTSDNPPLSPQHTDAVTQQEARARKNVHIASSDKDAPFSPCTTSWSG